MNNTTALLAALGKYLGTELTLENGVCALFDNGREVVIVEIPPAGDVAILHCKMAINPDPGLYEQLLRLNFDSGSMHGCWLALDDQGAVRLCAQLPLDQLNEVAFVQWVKGFVKQTEEMPGLIKLPGARGASAVASTAPRPAARRGF